MSELLTAAMRYADRGWPVFPLHTAADGRCSCGEQRCTSPAKHPRTRHGLRDATTRVETIRVWWLRLPSNVGIRTGAESRLVVVDVDGEQGAESLRALEREHGALPRTRAWSRRAAGSTLLSPSRCRGPEQRRPARRRARYSRRWRLRRRAAIRRSERALLRARRAGAPSGDAGMAARATQDAGDHGLPDTSERVDRDRARRAQRGRAQRRAYAAGRSLARVAMSTWTWSRRSPNW